MRMVFTHVYFLKYCLDKLRIKERLFSVLNSKNIDNIFNVVACISIDIKGIFKQIKKMLAIK